uniref:beta-galactosidase domain 4-containing protein n=1 Tax=Prevotella sp. TaxID=59823 RepID=UPI0040252180
EEVKYVYRDADFVGFKNHKLTLKNKSAFTNLADAYTLTYRVLADGKEVEKGAAAVPSCQPGATCEVDIPYTIAVSADKEYVVELSLNLKNNASWAKKGYSMVATQFKLGADAAVASVPVADPTFVEQPHGTLPVIGKLKGKLKIEGRKVVGKNFAISFAENGTIADWTFNGKQIVMPEAGPDFNGFRRIANDNISLGATGGVAENENKEEGAISGQKHLVKAPTKQGKNVVVETTVGNGKDTHAIVYTIYPNGVVDMKVTFENSSVDTRRVGITMQFAPGMENVEYYAKGPWSNYIDRQRSQMLGRYTTTVDGMFEEQSAPQTMGDRQGLRNLKLSGNGTSLNITVEGMLAFSLSHVDDQQFNYDVFYGGKHPYDLTRSPQVFAHFDIRQRGIGNHSCGGDSCLPQYQVPTGKHVVTMRFAPKAE